MPRRREGPVRCHLTQTPPETVIATTLRPLTPKRDSRDLIRTCWPLNPRTSISSARSEVLAGRAVLRSQTGFRQPGQPTHGCLRCDRWWRRLEIQMARQRACPIPPAITGLHAAFRPESHSRLPPSPNRVIDHVILRSLPPKYPGVPFLAFSCQKIRKKSIVLPP